MPRLRNLDLLTTPALREAGQRWVQTRTFRCKHCHNEIFTALANRTWTALNAAPHHRGSFVLVPNKAGDNFWALELTPDMGAGEFGKTAGLDTYVLHSRMCGWPIKLWWLDELDYHRSPAIPEIAVWLPPSEVHVGDRVVQAVPPEEGHLPPPSPSYVTRVGDGYVEFNGRRRYWDDRARIQVKRPMEGSPVLIICHMAALQALVDAGCRCPMPIPELRLGLQPICRRCRTDSGYIKGLHRRRGWADSPTHIYDVMRGQR